MFDGGTRPYLSSPLGSFLLRAEIPQKEPEKVPGALISVAKHVSSLKYHVWEKMAELVQFSKFKIRPKNRGATARD